MRILTTLILIIFLYGCGGGGSTESDPEIDWYRPDINTTWHWQLQGTINLDYNVELYDIDLFDTSEEIIETLHNQGKKVICYFSAGSYENWREDAYKFPKEAIGNDLDGWEGEKWLDIRNSTVREIMLERLDIPKKKGCDGVEPDNIDGYINDTGFELTYEDQLEYNKFLAQEAHLRGLSIGLKNDLMQINDLVDYFDFAINEQCHEFNECEFLTSFIQKGKPVFNAEYAQIYVIDEQERAKLCQKAKEENFRTLILPKDLDDSFRFECN